MYTESWITARPTGRVRRKFREEDTHTHTLDILKSPINPKCSSNPEDALGEKRGAEC